MLQRWHAGETRVWAVVYEPTVQQEDGRRLHRELQHLSGERTAHTNRIGALLVLHNLRVRRTIGGQRLGRLADEPSRAGTPDAARRDRARACAADHPLTVPQRWVSSPDGISAEHNPARGCRAEFVRLAIAEKLARALMICAAPEEEVGSSSQEPPV